MEQDKKSTYLFTVLFLLVIASIAATYWRYMVMRDFVVIETPEETTFEETLEE